MSNIIKHKRSDVSGLVPSTGSLEQGELAINIADGKLYTKNNTNSVINLGVTSISGALISPSIGNFNYLSTLDFDTTSGNITNLVVGSISGSDPLYIQTPTTSMILNDYGIYLQSDAKAQGNLYLEGPSISQDALLVTDSNKIAVSLTSPSLTEISYISGATSNIQTQLNSKQNTLSNPVTGTGISNHIPYWSSTSGLLADSNQLIWDANNNRLGLSVASPESIIDISGLVTNNASILIRRGINSRLYLAGGNSDADPFLSSVHGGNLSTATNGWGFFDRGTDGHLQIQRKSGSSSWTSAMFFDRSNGNVGIGTGIYTGASAVPERLVVDGNIRLADTATSIGNRLQLFRGGGSAYDYTISKEGSHLALSTANDGVTQRAVQVGVHIGTTWTPRIHMNGWTGQVGIGTTTPSVHLDVFGSGRVRGRCRVDNLTINTDTTTDNTASYLATMLLGSDGASLSGGGLQITSNTNRDANKALLGLVNHRLKTLSGGSSVAKTTFSSEYNADTSVLSTQIANGNFVNVLTLESGNLTLINQNLYIRNAPTPTAYNNTAGTIINSQAYVYMQGASSGSPARFNNIYNYYSRGQFATSHSYSNNFIDFYAAPIVGQTVPSGGITTRTALLIDYYDGNTAHITNPRGIWQLGNGVINHLAGNLGIGTTSPNGQLHVIGSGIFTEDVLVSGSIVVGSGTAALPTFEFVNDADTGMFNPVSNMIGFSTSGVERLRINDMGNVGIGTTVPQAGFRLDVNGAAVVRGNILTNATIQEFGNSRYQLHSGAASNSVSYVCNGGGRFGVGFTAPSGLVAISGGVAIGSNYNVAPPTNGLIVEGNVGLGTLSPSTKLYVSSTGNNDTTLEYLTSTVGFNSGVSPLKLLLNSVSGIAVGAGVGLDFVSRSSSTEYIGGRIQTIRTDTSNNHALTLSAGGGTVPLTEYVRIASNGNVGIGLTNPLSNLHVSGIINSNAEFRLGAAFSRVAIADSNGAFAGGYNVYLSGTTPRHNSNGSISSYYYHSDGSIRFYTNSSQVADTNASERLRILANGNVGIGITNPLDLVHISGSTASSVGIRFDNNDGHGGSVQADNGQLYLNSSTATAARLSGRKIRLGDGSANACAIELGTVGTISQDGNGGGLSFSGTIGQFSNSLYITAGNVGIGTITPSCQLHVIGSGIFSSGLNVSGVLTSNSGNFINSLQVNGTGVSVIGHTHTSSDITNFNSSVSGLITGTANYITKFNSTGSGITNSLIYDNGTYIGIGTATPNSELEINGTLISNNILSNGFLISNYLSSVNDFDGGTSGSIEIGELTSLNQMFWSINKNGSGNFTNLSVNNTGVSLNGHTHTSSDITNFNSSVSGLLPVTNITAGTNITISSTSGNFTINSTGGGGAGNVSGTGISNHIAYWNSSNGIVADSGQLVWDAANNRLGIGTNSPGSSLDVRGSAVFNEDGANVDFKIEGDTDSNLFFVDASTDSIGIGTAIPGSKLAICTFGADGTIAGASQTQIFQVNDASASDYVNLGHFNCESNLSRGSFMLSNNGTNDAWQDNVMQFFVHGASYPYGYYGGNVSDAGCAMIVTQGSDITKLQIGNYGFAPIEFFTDNTFRAIIDTAGNVGIGTSTPESNLQVVTDFSCGSDPKNGGLGMYVDGATGSVSVNDDGPGPNVSIDVTNGLRLYANGAGGQAAFFFTDRFNSRIGLKTDTPSCELDVSGVIKCNGISGSTISTFTPLDNQPPATNFATLDTRNSIAVLDFDDTTKESSVFVDIVPQGAVLSSGISIRIFWMATTATTGAVRWEVSVERCNTDLDADSFGTVATGSSTTNATAGIPTTTSITLTTIDGITVGDLYRLRVSRDAANGADTMVGDAELIAIEVRSVA